MESQGWNSHGCWPWGLEQNRSVRCVCCLQRRKKSEGASDFSPNAAGSESPQLLHEASSRSLSLMYVEQELAKICQVWPRHRHWHLVLLLWPPPQRIEGNLAHEA